MPNAVVKYNKLIEKGEELSLDINKYLASSILPGVFLLTKMHIYNNL